MPLGSAEGRPGPQALTYLMANGGGSEVRLADVHDDLADLARELDSLEAAVIINELRAQLERPADTVSVRALAFEWDGVVTKHGDPAVRDTVAFAATRLLKYIRR